MGITDFGDMKIIAEIYNDRHRKSDRLVVSSAYVGKLLSEERNTDSAAAREIMEIAKSYLIKKKKIKDQLVTA